ncbi:Signal recognition particle subunit SRP72 [Trametes pubescens]|uniref:Signal recognition particle subunit SRP72 n=1 Tax=Trametes pubescens TaxID=154538 RepID=A0A1M2VX28_TRAPU|nr:Signal recognition particle subunit SRP72 [Trametes pubescens]
MAPKATTKPTAKPGQKAAASRQKSAPKQPLPVADRLKRLFTSLCAQIDGGHFANAIKTCDKILRLDARDPDALQTKLFLLLQTDQYLAALTLIGGETGAAGDEHAFEKAYSLYRLHREDEATSVLDGLKETEQEDDRGLEHLEAQLAYRQGSYQKAVELYNHLLDTAEPDSEEQSDILTNLEAAQKHLDFINAGFLQALDALPSAVSSTLQTAPPPQPQPASALATVVAVSAPTEDATKRTKKVRVKRVPKGVVPGVTPPPDPERWLKKSERSTFTNRRRRGGGGGATQGFVETPGSAAAQSGKGAGGAKGKRKK